MGTTTHDTCNEDTYSTLLQRYQQSEEELRRVAEEWLECQQRIDAYVDEQMTMKTKQRMLTEDWELFKQRRFIEEQENPIYRVTHASPQPPRSLLSGLLRGSWCRDVTELGAGPFPSGPIHRPPHTGPV
ncbi:hypothetical protein GH733_006013 [Mirounga leonina]|nr:hypothetical protein GH733_006013 [Mirounga leonina]